MWVSIKYDSKDQKTQQRFQLKPSSQQTKHSFLTTAPPRRITAAAMQIVFMQTPGMFQHQSSYFDRAEFVSLSESQRRRPSVKKVYIAICDSPLNPPLSLYGSGLPVKPMSWQGHEIQYSVISPLIINNPPFKILISIILCHRTCDVQNAGKWLKHRLKRYFNTLIQFIYIQTGSNSKFDIYIVERSQTHRWMKCVTILMKDTAEIN